MINTFLFDFDGTVANTIPGILATLEKTRETMNADFTLEAAKGVIGTPLEEMGRVLCGEDRALEFVEMYHREYLRWGKDKISFYPGMEPLLKELTSVGVRRGVVTSKRADSLTLNLKTLKAAAYFDCLVTKESTDRFKPDGAPVLRAMELLSSEPERTVMIGDTRYDIESGRNAAALTIGVTWGIESKEQILKSSPDYVVSSGEDLAELCRRLMRV